MIRPDPFSAELVRHDGVLVLALAGELDLATAPVVEAALPAPAPGEVLLIDLRELSFIDSSGIQILMRLDLAARRDGWTFALVRGPRDVQRVLDLCHLGDRIWTVDAPAEISPAVG
jgi:anti-anti-sigma factor